MSYFFTDNFRQALQANQGIMDGQKIKVVLFRYAPAMGYPNSAWTAAKTVPELIASSPGWVEVTSISGYPMDLLLDVGTRVLGGSRYVMFSDYRFTELLESAEIRAIAIVRVAALGGVNEPLIFVTNTPVNGVTNLAPDDALTASPDSTFPDATNRWLFGWSTTAPDPTEGPLVLSRGSPDFEVSGSQHAWLYPQRANMIANPSFEAPGTNFWSSSSALARVSGGAPGSGAWSGSCGGNSPGYLTPTVGTVTTPDPGPLPSECTFVFKTQGPFTRSGYHTVAAQTVAGNASWFLQRRFPSGTLQLGATTAVGTYPSAVSGVTLGATTSIDETWAMSLDLDDGAGQMQLTAFHPVGGVWTQVATASAPTMALADASSPVSIGGYDGVNAWNGRIYSVELRTGLDPAKGTVIWKFDASDYPGTGTSYIDPRGRTWTLSSASAITPKTGPLPGYVVMESNIFPTLLGELNSEQWTVQLMAKGSGKLKVGLVYWDADYRMTAVDWGDDETWDLAAGAWTHVATHRRAPEAAIAMVRLELQGDLLTIDRVLAERGYLKDWLYFDGDEKYGARDDFSWYGGSNRQGQTYSLWYNHRKAVTGRLFARTVDPNDPSQNVTDEDMEEQGLVYRWVPAGITVVPHLDIFYPFDAQNPLPPKAAGILPYWSTGTPDGVVSPWG